MKRVLYTALATFVIASGLALAVQPSFAQTSTGTGGTKGTTGTGGGNHKGENNSHGDVEKNPACEKILGECRKLGFIQGQWKKDNGLWKDCFIPVVKGKGNATRDGKPISVPVSQAEIESCRASEANNTHGHKGTGANASSTPGTTGK